MTNNKESGESQTPFKAIIFGCLALKKGRKEEEKREKRKRRGQKEEVRRGKGEEEEGRINLLRMFVSDIRRRRSWKRKRKARRGELK